MAEEPKTITLQSADKEIFEVTKASAMQSQLLRDIIRDTRMGDQALPISNISSRALAKVLEYCNYHSRTNDDKKWDAEFVKDMDKQTLFDVLNAANYLDIKDLLNLGCQAVAGMIAGKSSEEIRQTFGIKNDFSPEEKEQILREHEWAFK